jgi:hypothetical protein
MNRRGDLMTQISDNERAGSTFGAQSQGQAPQGGMPPWTPPQGQAPQWGQPQGQAPYGQPQYWGPQPPAGWHQPNGAPYPYPVMQPYFVPVPQPVAGRTNGTAISHSSCRCCGSSESAPCSG